MANIETKSFQGFTLKADTATGIVTSYTSIFGNLDAVESVVHPGAFKRSISERGPAAAKKIRVLWQHEVKQVIGKPLRMEEHSRDLLPESVKSRYPEASGGLYCETKFNLDVQQGREAFALYREEDMDEWSFGFDDLTNSGKREYDQAGIRHLRELRIMEYSPVTFGANEATTTVSVKSNLLTMLDEVSKEHPEFSDIELIDAVEKRLSPESPAAEASTLLSSQQQKHRVESLRIQIAIDQLRLRGKIYA